MDKEIEEKIWEFIDGNCDPAEKESIQKRIEENQEWHAVFVELNSISQMLQSQKPDMPSLRFTKNVMEEISQYNITPAAKNYINKNVIRGIGAFFLAMIAGLFIYFLAHLQWTSQPTDKFVPSYRLDAGQLNWGRLLNNTYANMFIGVNVILGLIVLDKYFQGKKNSEYPGGHTESDSA